MSAALTLEQYKQASRDSLEEVIERIAKIEQAADLQAGSLVQLHLENLADESAEEIIERIEGEYELESVPADWRERVREALGE